jgi:hypothetical protein
MTMHQKVNVLIFSNMGPKKAFLKEKKTNKVKFGHLFVFYCFLVFLPQNFMEILL